MLENRDCTPHLTAGILAVKEEMGIWTGLYADLDSRKQPCVLERHNSHTIKKQISFKPFFICMYIYVCAGHTCTCVQNPEDSLGCHSSAVSPHFGHSISH